MSIEILKSYTRRNVGENDHEPVTEIFKEWGPIVQRSGDNYSKGIELGNRDVLHEIKTRWGLFFVFEKKKECPGSCFEE